MIAIAGLPDSMWEPEKNQVVLPLILLSQLCQRLFPGFECLLSAKDLSNISAGIG